MVRGNKTKKFLYVTCPNDCKTLKQQLYKSRI